MSAPTQLIQKTLSNSSFLGFKLKSQIKSVNEDQVLSNAALVITKCQEFLALTNNTHLPPLLDAVIDNTARLVQLLQDQRVNKTTRHAKEIAALCKQLETQSLKLPTNMHPPKTLSSTSYNIAVVCFYLLAFSVSIAIGASFGAWYFGYLATGYFTDVLVTTLSTVGIPATCLVLLSFGLYSSHEKSANNKRTLGENIDSLCETVLMEVDPEEEKPIGIEDEQATNRSYFGI